MEWRTAAVLAATFVLAGGHGDAAAPVKRVAIGQPPRALEQASRALEIVAGGSRIGVSVRDVEEADGKTPKGTAGAIVDDVSSDSPAEKAGIRKGDVIVEFDGERVRSVRQLTRLVQETPPGRSVPVAVVRDGQRTTLTVIPGDGGRFPFDGLDFDRFDNFAYRLRPRVAPPTPPSAPKPPAPPSDWKFDELLGGSGRLGITLDALSSQLAEYFGAKQGALVTSVYDNSAAAKAGLKAGDVITSFNGSPVDDPADVRRRSREMKDGEEFTVEVMRDRKLLTLKGKAERSERARLTRRVI